MNVLHSLLVGPNTANISDVLSNRFTSPAFLLEDPLVSLNPNGIDILSIHQLKDLGSLSFPFSRAYDSQEILVPIVVMNLNTLNPSQQLALDLMTKYTTCVYMISRFRMQLAQNTFQINIQPPFFESVCGAQPILLL